MSDKNVQLFKDLKERFEKLSKQERENIGVCFLKVKLGVHNPHEFDAVTKFLGKIDVEINTQNLDGIMNYLHSKSHTLPEFIAMEESLSDVTKPSMFDHGMANYDPDEVETLEDDPIKD